MNTINAGEIMENASYFYDRKEQPKVFVVLESDEDGYKEIYPVKTLFNVKDVKIRSGDTDEVENPYRVEEGIYLVVDVNGEKK